MKKYLYQAEKFGLSDEGIHLLRSGFNYRTISYSEVQSLRIEKGIEANNWLIGASIGFIIFATGIYLSIFFIESLVDNNIGHRGAIFGLVLLNPFIGGYFMYHALKTGIIIKLTFGNDKKVKLPTGVKSRNSRFLEVHEFLKQKLGTKYIKNLST